MYEKDEVKDEMNRKREGINVKMVTVEVMAYVLLRFL
jgi:hypothetical protein